MDLVYIVKEDENNEELRYSLRSIEKFVKYDKIWIVGYKPSWVQNVEYIHTEQNQGKWKNSVNNIIAACNNKDISDNFVLMNDDFFAIRQINDLEKSCNVALGTLDQAISKYINHRAGWFDAFKEGYELLEQLGVEKPYYNYESHSPMIINKKDFMDFINLPQVQEFIKTNKVLHKRSIYKNIYKITPRILPADVKIEADNDIKTKTKILEWISVYDKQIHNLEFPQLNYVLKQLFPTQCKYEAFVTQIKPFGNPPRKKKDFIHY